jgi:RNA polymerase sigma-70 factor (ECF subfamily)
LGVTEWSMPDRDVMMASMRERGRDVTPARGDLDQLVRTHAPALSKHVRYVYPFVDVDEVVSQTFVVAWQHFDAIPVGAEAVWLRAVTRRVVANYRRGERRWHALTDRFAQLTPMPQILAPDNPEHLELQAVVSAIDTLSEADRQVLLMMALEELSTEDLATVLDVRPNAAKKRLSRARTRLRGALSDSAADPAGGDRS